MTRTFDDDSAVAYENDCQLFVSPTTQGIILKDVKIQDLDKIIPLLYKLEIPADVYIPDNLPLCDREPFVQKVFSMIANEFDALVWRMCQRAKAENAYFFCGLVNVFGTVPILLSKEAKVSWRLFGFQCHSQCEFISGIDNLVYTNISTRIDILARNGKVEFEDAWRRYQH